MVPKAIAASALFFLLGALPAYAQTPPDVVLTSCVPNVAVAKDNTFVSKRGDIVVFKCTLSNKEDTETTVLVSGERTQENTTDPTSAMSVATAVSVPARGTTTADIPFIALFENGTYRYALSLKSVSDGAAIGSSFVFTGMLAGETIRIIDALLDKNSYGPADTVSLAVTVATSSPGAARGEPAAFFLDSVVKGEDGKTCFYLILDRPVTNVAQSVDLSLAMMPSDCTPASLGIILKTKDGFPQDSRDIPLVIRAAQSSSAVVGWVTPQFMAVLFIVVGLAGLTLTLRLRRPHSVNPPAL